MSLGTPREQEGRPRIWLRVPGASQWRRGCRFAPGHAAQQCLAVALQPPSSLTAVCVSVRGPVARMP